MTTPRSSGPRGRTTPPPRQQPTKTSRKLLRRGHRARFFVALGLVALVVLVGIAEVVVHHAIDHRISTAAEKRLTGPVDVGIGSTPALIDAIHGQVSTVTIHAPATTVCSLSDIDATATLGDVHRNHSDTEINSVNADIVLTTKTFTNLLGQTYSTATVTSDPAQQELQIGVGPGGLLQVNETAHLNGDTIDFAPTGVAILGRAAPQALDNAITSRLTVQHTLTDLPLGLTPRSLSFTNNGLQVDLTAGQTQVNTNAPVKPQNCNATTKTPTTPSLAPSSTPSNQPSSTGPLRSRLRQRLHSLLQHPTGESEFQLPQSLAGTAAVKPTDRPQVVAINSRGPRVTVHRGVILGSLSWPA